jgi:hypothetical protein
MFDSLPPDPRFAVAPAAHSDLPMLGAMCQAQIPGIAADLHSFGLVQAWSRSILSIGREGRIAGCFAGLFLNDRGHQLLLDGRFPVARPVLDYLAYQGTRASAIYVWAVCYPGAAMGTVMQWLKQPEYRHAPLYARPVTAAALAMLKRRGAVPLEGHPYLWIYRRATH